MANGTLHSALLAAFSNQEQKALLCDPNGRILSVSQPLIHHCQTTDNELVDRLLVLESVKFSESHPWFQHLTSHHRETRIQGAAFVDEFGELSLLNIITIKPLVVSNVLTGFSVTLEDDSLFERSLPTAAWHQLFKDSQEGMCLFDEHLAILSANQSFKDLTKLEDDERPKISELLAVEDSFKHWFLNSDLLPSQANITRNPDIKSAFISITPIDLGGRQVFWCTLKDAAFITSQTTKLSNSFKRFRTLFDDNANGIALASPEGAFIEVNKQLADLLQYDRNEIIGKHFRFFNAPGSFELPEEDARVFIKTGFCHPFEKKLLRKDGTVLKVAVQLFPNFDASGGFTGAWNFISPLDDHRQETINKARYFEALFESGQDAMILTKLDGQVLMANNAFENLVGHSKQDLLDANIRNITLEDDSDFEEKLHTPMLMNRGYTDLFEKRLISESGAEIPVSVRSVLVKNHQGKPEAIWTIAREASIQRKLIQSLAISERRFRSLFSNSIDAIGFWTKSNELQYANKAYLELVGYSQEELRGLTYLDFTPPGWEEADAQMADQVDERGYSDIFEKEVLRKDGQRIPISIRASAMKDHDGVVVGSWVIIRDISEHKETLRKLQHSQNLLKQTSRMSRVGGWELNPAMTDFSLTEETFQILSIPRSYHTSVKNVSKLFDPTSEKRAISVVSKVFEGAGTSVTELKLLGFSPERWIRVSAQLAFEESGQRYVYGAVQDISDFIEQQKSLESARDTYQRLAFHDPLTNLPNRLLLEDRFQQISNQARRDKKMVSLMIIDLDDFKTVNDDYGHPAGDALLIKIAKRLQKSIRSSDTVARLGGDEFVVIAMLVDQAQAQALAEKILKSVEKPVKWKNKHLSSSCSVGVTLCEKHDLSFEQLYAQADGALYSVKASGKSNFSFASSEKGS